MKLKTIMLISVIIPMTSAAYTVKGRVVDAVTAEAEPSALVKLYQPQDTVKPILSSLTDIDGNFLLSTDEPGDYILKVSFTGTKDTEVSFGLLGKMPDVDLGSIVMYPDAEILQEVVVTGRRPVIQADGEKVVYNVNEDPASGQKTAIEMLRKVPMVTVDGQDNIRVNGSSNFKIYLNGKPNPMLGENASLVLKSFPASAIRKIEVIMEPGAKYESEGTGGILNIVTETSESGSGDGSMATVTLGMNNRNANVSLYGISRYKKVTSSLNISYFNNSFNSQKIDGDIERTSYDSEEAFLSKQKLEMLQRNHFVNGALNLSWEPNVRNLFTVSGNIMYGWGDYTSNTLTRLFARSGDFTGGSAQWMKNDWTWGNYSVNGSYQHNFSDNGHNIVVSYQYERGLNGTDSRSLDHSFENMSVPFPALFNSNHTPSNTSTVQLDYTLPFPKNYTFETGGKGIFRRNRAKGYTHFASSLADLDVSKDGEPETDMKQYQDVLAVYGSLGAVWNNYSAKAGVRYEYTHMGVDFMRGDYNDFRSDLNDVVPNIAVGYNFSPMSSVRASYQMRIRRPSVSELNPHETFRLTNVIEMGNPALTSEKTHNINLTYSDFKGILGYNIVAAYKFSNNQIGNYFYSENDILYETYDNIGNMKEGSLSAFLTFRPSSTFSLNVNGAVRYKDYNFKAEGLKNHGWTGNFGADISYTMPWKLLLNVYGGASFREVELQSHRSGWKYYGLSLSRNFLKDDRLKVSLNATNFIDGNFKIKVDNWSDSFYNRMKMKVDVWSAGISVSYTFGGLNERVKSTKTKIVNDDVQQSKGGGATNIN